MSLPLSLPSRRYAIVLFFGLTFALTWGLWIPSALAAQGRLAFPIPATLAGLLGAWAPGLVALVLTLVLDGRGGMRLLLRRLTLWRVGWPPVLFALGWPALLSLAVTGLTVLSGSPPPDFAHPPVVRVYPAPPEAFQAGFLPLLPLVFLTQLFGSSLGEEMGWRGFALSRLQARMSALQASLVIGLLWGLWHFPRQWTPGQPFDGGGFGWLVLALVLNAVLYTWLFNIVGGSLVPALLLHTSQAVTGLFLAATPNPPLEAALTALVALLLVRRYRSPLAGGG